MDYKQKYLKYKNKYIKLKGGVPDLYLQCKISNDIIKCLYLPCEISNDIKKIFYNSKATKTLDTKLEDDDLFTNICENHNCIIDSKAIFNQDSAIFLKSVDDKDFAISIQKSELNLSLFNIISGYESINGSDYGGNFISSPPKSETDFGTVFCFDKVTPKLHTYLEKILIQNIIKLKCSFRYRNERHIDECMCFMPYKTHYKVWIYKIRNIVCPFLIKEKLKKQLARKNTDTTIDNPIILQIQDIPKIYDTFETERQQNIKLILDDLSHSNKFAGFVEFPIDLEINQYGFEQELSYKITTIPIFNRIWYEKDDKCRAIFSHGRSTDSDIETILTRELPNVGSIINQDRKFKFNKIITSEFNNMGDVGGNLHCLVKMKY